MTTTIGVATGAQYDTLGRTSIANKRFYKYDNLLRLTCEAKGSTGVNPSASDCNTTSTRLVQLASFTNGTSATDPPENRKTAFLRNTGYTSPGLETYAYAGAADMIQSITRGSDTVQFQYDALGRRASEWLSSNVTGTARWFTYAPTGQLAKITGKYTSGSAMTVLVAYDADGRPVKVTDGPRTRELFWDDSGSLLVYRITDASVSPTKTITWSYHYLEGQPIAATRKIVQTTTTTTRYWFVYDERGLIYQARDASNTLAWQASYAASGWRTVESSIADFSVPFLFPGQVLLDITDSSPTGQLALNGQRVYSPYSGTYLQPDGADLVPRSRPERYSYARANPVLLVDPTGAASTDPSTWLQVRRDWGIDGGTLSFEIVCDDLGDAATLAIALAKARRDIEACTNSFCSRVAENRLRWLVALSTGRWTCEGSGPVPNGTLENPFSYPIATGALGNDTSAYAVTFTGSGDSNVIGHGALSGNWFYRRSGGCLEATVAHESLHKVFAHTTMWEAGMYEESPDFDQWITRYHDRFDAWLRRSVDPEWEGNQSEELEVDAYTAFGRSEGDPPCIHCD